MCACYLSAALALQACLDRHVGWFVAGDRRRNSENAGVDEKMKVEG